MTSFQYVRCIWPEWRGAVSCEPADYRETLPVGLYGVYQLIPKLQEAAKHSEKLLAAPFGRHKEENLIFFFFLML